MFDIRRGNHRGNANFGWLDSRHSFSFGQYFDPDHMGFGPLRVINEDHVAAGAGFDTHGHKNMEIVSYVLEGALEHKDSLGTGSVIRPGDVQRMSAGTGIRHSEFNHSKSDPVHFLQIWIMPEKTGIAPGYEQKNFDETEKRGKLRLVAFPDGKDGSVRLHQDAHIYSGLFDGDEQASIVLEKGRGAWVQIARGSAQVSSEKLGAGDGAAIQEMSEIEISNGQGAEILLFDLPLPYRIRLLNRSLAFPSAIRKRKSVMGWPDVIRRVLCQPIIIQMNMHIGQYTLLHLCALKPGKRFFQMCMGGVGLQLQAVANPDFSLINNLPAFRWNGFHIR